jgi:hypothetical protein
LDFIGTADAKERTVESYYLGIIGWLLLICLLHSIRIRRLAKVTKAANGQDEAENEHVAAEG